LSAVGASDGAHQGSIDGRATRYPSSMAIESVQPSRRDVWGDLTRPLAGDLGLLTWLISKLAWLLGFVSPCSWLLALCRVGQGAAARRTRWVDGYILGIDAFIGILVGCQYKAGGSSAPVGITIGATILVGLRISEIIQANFVRHLGRAGDRAPANHVRTVVLAVWNYVEFACGFAYFYWAFHLIKDSNSLWESAYFSFVTQLTIGYGDFSPCPGWGRAIVVVQGLIGFVFTAVLVGRFVSIFPPPRRPIRASSRLRHRPRRSRRA
jgi:hypothetical protein